RPRRRRHESPPGRPRGPADRRGDHGAGSRRDHRRRGSGSEPRGSAGARDRGRAARAHVPAREEPRGLGRGERRGGRDHRRPADRGEGLPVRPRRVPSGRTALRWCPVTDLPQRFSNPALPARDGLQAEPRTLPVPVRLELIGRLAEAGLSSIEAGSFVSPRAVPQMADTASVLAGLDLDSSVSYPVLVPNRRGLEDAMTAGAADVSVFISVTESFSQANLGGSLDETTQRGIDTARAASVAGLRVRGYLSMVFGDPWEGAVDPNTVAGAAR